MDQLRKRQINTFARSLVIAIGLITLLFIGSASISIAVSKVEANGDSPATRAGQCYISTFMLPDDDGSMEKNESSESEKSIYFIIQAVISAQNFDNIRPNLKLIESRSYQDLNPDKIHILTTTASISTQKAIEFTLVGAKPSGTS
jgi:hypothetical protein